MLARVGRILAIALLLLVGTVVFARYVPGLSGRFAIGVSAALLLVADYWWRTRQAAGKK